MQKFPHRPLIIGHRGHWKSTENTLQSFHEAVDEGAEMLEFDVQLSKDGVPFVFHDYTLKRLTGGGGAIRTRTSRHLSELVLPGDTRIPTLREALEEMLPRVPVNIEMKFNHVNYRPLVLAVGQCVADLGAEKRVLVSSFLHYALQQMNRFFPKIPTAPLYLQRWSGAPYDDELEALAARGEWDTELPFQRPALVLHHPMIDEAFARRCRELDLSVLSYTVDDHSEMERLSRIPIQGLITNRPGEFKEVLSKGPFP